MDERYRPSEIEAKWQEFWSENKVFKSVEDPSKPKYYVLDMFPYPSGDGLHVGHPEGYTATDIVSRYKRMKGFNVLHPMGWDAFGLPAERHAMRTGQHPAITTKKNTDHFRNQIKQLGFSYDWDREIDTSSAEYYRWTQWIFLKLYEAGLAYQAEVDVNWCPRQGTVLANEEVKDGCYVETGDPVEKRKMKQWMLKITAYAERLLEDLDTLDWTDGVKEMQRNWIGKSTGADVVFAIDGTDKSFTVFTTRPDTLFGATYCVFSPEHPFVENIVSDDQRDAVAAYVAEAAQKSDKDRMDEEREKTGVFTGAYAVNPVNGERIPIWVADYVLMGYGTGAIMAVPAHDTRDLEFAQKFDLPVTLVVEAPESEESLGFTGDGTSINSGPLTGLSTPEAKKKIIAILEEKGVGKATVNYRLRDWLFSRQRYWGEPFPVIELEDGTVKALRAEDLPVILPELDEYRPTDDGRPPLARAEDWVSTTDPETGQPAKRETNTMPQWAGSCWYYLRYLDPFNNLAPYDKEKEKYWMPVDLYLGGAEHAVLHLLYARFWHKVLFDAGWAHTKEPFQKLVNQGMVLAYSYRDARGKYHYPHEAQRNPDGNGHVLKETGEPLDVKMEKMSKSRYNVVNPDDVIERYGADAMRMYEMFMGPLDRDVVWTEEGIEGVYRFLGRVWRLFVKDNGLNPAIVDEAPTDDMNRLLHRTIAKVTEEIEELRFNTAIAKMMEFTNDAYKMDTLSKAAMEDFVKLLSPFAPHIGEELWRLLGHSETVAYVAWPDFDEQWLTESLIPIAVQINGKRRTEVKVPADAEAKEVLEIVKQDEKVQSYLEKGNLKKEIYVPGRLVNFVVK